MEELRKFQSSTFDTIARRRLVEDQDTILELAGGIQEKQNEINCVCVIQRSFRVLNQFAVENFSRSQSASVIPSSSNSWRNAKTFFWSAEPQRRAAKHLGHAWYIGKRFCRSTCIFISSISSRIESVEFIDRGAALFIHSGEKWKTKTRSRSEMTVWTVSQKLSHLQWRRLFQELWVRPTTTADFGSSFW